MYCEQCGMAANVERAECSDDAPTPESIAMLPAEEVYTPDTKTIEEVAAYLGINIEQTIKALLLRKYDDEGNEDGFVAAFIRGDRELNMIKLVNALGIAEHQIEFADEHEMDAVTNAIRGLTTDRKSVV